jgi:hypothetical protein
MQNKQLTKLINRLRKESYKIICEDGRLAGPYEYKQLNYRLFSKKLIKLLKSCQCYEK